MTGIDRTAVISGAGTGIGAACAQRLAASCTRMVLLGRRQDRLDAVADGLVSEHPGLRVDARSVDLTDSSAIEHFASSLREENATVDVLVNNAGSPQPRSDGSLSSLAQAWESTWRANTLSAVLLTEALKDMLPRPGGRIITIGSFAAELGTGSPAYASAKAALGAYSKCLMRELGPAGITSNIVAPGYTAGTELLEGRITPERHERLISGIAARRPGTPAEIASLVAYLASEPAGYVNGQVLTANGGTYLTA